MFNTIFGVGGAGAASRYGSSSDQMMRLRLFNTGRNAGMSEYRKKVSPALLIFPLVRRVSPASASVRYRWWTVTRVLIGWQYSGG
jgi:hypothetical protein